MDSQNQVVELNKLNNTTIFATPVVVQHRQITCALTQMTLPATGVAGATGQISLVVNNRGNLSLTTPVGLDFVLSPSGVFGNADNIPLASVANWATNIAANGSKTFSATVTIPQGTPPGIYYVVAHVDAHNPDVNTSDAVTAAPITVNAPVVNLAGAVAVTAPSVSVPGDAATVTVTVTNQGNVPAVGAINVNAYLSLDPTLDTQTDRPLVRKAELVDQSGPGQDGHGHDYHDVPVRPARGNVLRFCGHRSEQRARASPAG